MPTTRTNFGWRGEELARSFLEQQGMTFVGRHFRTRYGEIDLIMKDDQTLVFVEVKSRRTRKFGLAEESVTPSKVRRMEAAAERYLQEHPPEHGNVRFDLVVLESGRRRTVRHLRGIL